MHKPAGVYKTRWTVRKTYPANYVGFKCQSMYFTKEREMPVKCRLIQEVVYQGTSHNNIHTSYIININARRSSVLAKILQKLLETKVCTCSSFKIYWNFPIVIIRKYENPCMIKKIFYVVSKQPVLTLAIFPA